ncbi:MAG: D-alanyl-D-alanine carboxypeptidase/D-alanyl-D-alanine-endopeptidase, partial [Candidatus Eremiobacteraeota bacterium]|nr:D-alanyl-D-alanine carboxypeptidase/D-alanyl-D-alanine-endopeptidase [Candidatus Eremiobacteraeota bacterium]
GYAAATSAVSLDQDTVEIHVTPGAPGSSARISIEPPNVNVVVGGEVTTEWGADDVEIVRSPGSPGDPLPLRNAFTLHGHVPPGPVRKYWKLVLGMPSYAGGAIVALLGERGIAAPDEVVFERAPVVAQTLWLHRSQPLGAIVTEMLVHSNNHSAEQLLRLVGAAASGGVGTDASGLAAARRELRRLGVPYAGMRAYDGSGLAPDDKIAPLTLAELVAAELRGSRGNAFLQALPRVGMEGTVQYHELHAALGHARAKSGHLSGVNALAGTVQTRSHGRVTFAFVVNDPRSESRAVYLAQDRALDLLAEF